MIPQAHSLAQDFYLISLSLSLSLLILQGLQSE